MSLRERQAETDKNIDWLKDHAAPQNIDAHRRCIEYALAAERAHQDAEIARLREALSRIVEYMPTAHDEFRPKFEALHAESMACAECETARKRQWPPSRLCHKHYSAMASLERSLSDRSRYQDAWGRADIARAALREEAPDV